MLTWSRLPRTNQTRLCSDWNRIQLAHSLWSNKLSVTNGHFISAHVSIFNNAILICLFVKIVCQQFNLMQSLSLWQSDHKIPILFSHENRGSFCWMNTKWTKKQKVGDLPRVVIVRNSSETLLHFCFDLSPLVANDRVDRLPISKVQGRSSMYVQLPCQMLILLALMQNVSTVNAARRWVEQN